MAQSKEEPTFTAPFGFTAIPVRFSEEGIGHHCLYAQVNTGEGKKDKTLPKNRTLLVINIPAYVTEKCLSEIFNTFGLVQSAELVGKPGPTLTKHEYFSYKTIKGFRTAYVVFKNVSGIQKFKSNKVKTALVLPRSEDFVKAGIRKWIEEYENSFTDVAVLQVEIDNYMQEYDTKLAQREDKTKEEEGVPDEEGWITVTRQGRRPGTERSEAMNHRLVEKEKKKRAQKELLNFYSWQHRSRKNAHLEELRKKFEEDKQKIALMRADRKFRPY